MKALQWIRADFDGDLIEVSSKGADILRDQINWAERWGRPLSSYGPSPPKTLPRRPCHGWLRLDQPPTESARGFCSKGWLLAGGGAGATPGDLAAAFVPGMISKSGLNCTSMACSCSITVRLPTNLILPLVTSSPKVAAPIIKVSRSERFRVTLRSASTAVKPLILVRVSLLSSTT